MTDTDSISNDSSDSDRNEDPPEVRDPPRPEPREETEVAPEIDRFSGQEALENYCTLDGHVYSDGELDLSPPMSDARQADIDAFVEENALATTSEWVIGTNEVGGTRVGEALTGNSELGTLTIDERDYLAERAVTAWSVDQNRENLIDVQAAVAGDPVASRAMAAALAAPAGEAARHFEDGGRYYETEGASDYRDDMLEAAIDLDPAAAVRAFEGVEHVLAARAMGEPVSVAGIPGMADDLLDAVNDGQVSRAAADRMVSAMFVHATENNVPHATAERLAEAISHVTYPAVTSATEPARVLYENRLTEVLTSGGGRELLLNENVTPETRAWALDMVATDATWTAEALENGWESDVVTLAHGEMVAERYSEMGVIDLEIDGMPLRNVVGQSLGLMPDNLPPVDETAADAAARLAAGTGYAYYSADSHAAHIADQIEAIGGPGAMVSVVPVAITSNEFGVASTAVFRVESTDGSVGFVDDQGQTYEDLDHWQSQNELPPGRFTAAEGLEPGAPLAAPENTRLVRDSFGEWARSVGDTAALVVGVGAGIAIIVGSAGTGTFLVAGAAGLYTAGRAGEELYQDQRRGHDILDFSNPEMRGRWLEAAAGTLSIGAIGGGLRLASLTRNGVQASASATRAVAGVTLAADVFDAAAMADQGVQLAANWEALTPAERAMGVLNTAFYGGLMAASVRSGGGALPDAFNYGRLENQLATGTPYDMTEVPGLAPGEVRVAYDIVNGRPTNVRLETGAGPIDPAAISLHSVTARQVEVAGGLRARLSGMLPGQDAPPVGSEAWEADLEIQKITRESEDLAAALSAGTLTPEERGALEIRQIELNDAIVAQSERLDLWDQTGTGSIAAPHRGAVQAESLNWPEAPAGHTWVAGSDGTPHLRQIDGEGDPLSFDPATETFVPRGSVNNTRTVGDGTNTATWETNAEGHLVSVEATLRSYTVNGGRSPAELAAQSEIRALGLPTDHAGHAIAHRFLGDQGIGGMFPQDANLNTGAYSTLENEFADWIAAGGEVRVEVDLLDFDGPRPETIRVKYDVYAPGNSEPVTGDVVMFNNTSGEVYRRVSSEEIQRFMEQA